VTHRAVTETQRLLQPLSTQWVQSVTGVSRETVSQWRNGATPRPDRWERLVAALRAVLPEAQEEAPRPAWVEGLESRLVREIRMNGDVITGRADGGDEPSLQRQEELLAEVLARLGGQEPSAQSLSGSAREKRATRGTLRNTRKPARP
jgi:hypothetical protein